MSGLPKLTDWIDGRMKPNLPGLYQRRWTGLIIWSKWTGSRWLRGREIRLKYSMECADDERSPSGEQCLPWRGLSEPPQ